MSAGSEAVLYDIFGDPMAVEVDTAIPTGTALLIGGGSDGTNARYIKVDSSGNQVMIGLGTAGTPTGGILTIQGDPSGTPTPISGTVTANAGSGNFSVVQATASLLNATVIGTVTANIGTSGALALDSTLAKLTISPGTAIGSNTLAMVGGSVTTVSPTYTNGNINPLSLTTAGALRIDGSAVTQPVSGTVTSNQGTANTVVNAWPIKVTDSTNTATVKPASTAAVAADPALVVAVSPNNVIPVSIQAGNNNIGDVDVATIAGTADSGNSTTATLGSGATFTGTSFDTLNYPTAVVIVKSNVASATNGLKFQWSGDGTNWDVESGSEVLANAGRGFHVSHRGRYFRIQYVNGGSAQTFFRLNVIHRPSTVGIITRPLDDNIDDKNFAQITRSVLTAKTPGGSYVNINANNGGNLKTTNDSAYNEDTAHNTGDMGTFVLGVRNDSATSLTNANGDYSPFATDSAGRIGISDLGGSVTVDGTVIVVGAAADGAVPSGNPVLIAGQDGTNVQSIATDGYGRIQVTITGSSSNTQVEGRAADGTTPVGNPVYIGGHDGINIQAILTDTQGRIVIAPSGASTSNGFSFGEIILAATTISPIRSTTYTEPSVGAQRSISSSNVNDTSAGTGARTVKVTYYTLNAGTVAGPFTETITLNGTSTVDTVATNICYIEKMEVMTVGSGGSNAGVITLFGATGGGGGTVWTIATGVNRTLGAHHYVPSSKTCNVTTFSGGIKGADTTGVFLRTKDPTNANSAEIQISDTLRAPSSGNTPIRTYGTPIKVPGPARITAFTIPDSTSSRTYYASFDFYEE